MLIRTASLLTLLVAVPAASAAPAGDFNTCLKELRGRATSGGISAQTFDTAMAGVEPDQSVLDAMEAQPEFVTPVWDYLALLVDEQRIAEDQRFAASLRSRIDPTFDTSACSVEEVAGQVARWVTGLTLQTGGTAAVTATAPGAPGTVGHHE